MTAGFSILFFFLFSQFNQVAQLLWSYEIRLELKRGDWVLAQIDTVKFASFSVHGLKNISSHSQAGAAKKFTEKRKAKDLLSVAVFGGNPREMLPKHRKVRESGVEGERLEAFFTKRIAVIISFVLK